ncbi:unnamed protein product [Prorocentrum cordatum]|uniref:EF-hand domain-containing protein n=1 Tax=Prorocentrum cordatum TaxID=2364126 RepID=A0ABN9T947_9DINO|nr:unnamed protein product [Polarella glacialis]
MLAALAAPPALVAAAAFASVSAVPDTSLMQMVVRGEAHAALLAPAGFTQVGRHCDCGGTVAEWPAGARGSVEACAAECLRYPSCQAFALFVGHPAWQGACRLYDAPCEDTNGWEQGTTCRSPTANPGGDNVGYNKKSGYEQLYYSTGACSVSDGSAFSSAYPCGCGGEVCLDGQVCGGTSCYLAESLSVSWPSECLSIGSTEFRRTGRSASGAPVYSNGEGTYMYYDPYCDGNELMPGQWIIDSDEPNLSAVADLDGDGKCSDLAHVASAYLSGPVTEGVSWQIACDGKVFRGRGLNISLSAGSSRIAGRTPEPTLAPGQPCQCEGCGGFSLYDVDGNGCLIEGEVDRVEAMRGLFSGLDADGDGCVTQAECSTYVEQHNLELPKYTPPITEECDYGMYLPDQASVCVPCVGGSTSRRRSHTCTPCADAEFDAGMYDDCVGGIYLTDDADEGNCTVHTNDVEGVFQRGDRITIATRNPGHFEEVTITGTSPIQIDRCLNLSFKTYDPVRRACTSADGFSFSSVYPCGCGKATCEEGQACNMGSSTGTVYRSNGTTAGTAGMCITRVHEGEPMPTPNPTISARGDPHLVNLQGEHFDVNHGGEFSLLRIPQDTKQPAGFSLMSTITAEYNRPCITYITQVALSGTWFDEKSLEVRSYLRSHSNETADRFLGARVLSAADREGRSAGLCCGDGASESFGEEPLVSELGAGVRGRTDNPFPAQAKN